METGTTISWSVIISTIALVISVATAIFSMWHNQKLQRSQQNFEHKFKQVEVIEQAKIKIVKNKERINGLFNLSHFFPDEKTFAKAAKIHAQNYSLYKGIEHRFSNETRTKLDKIITELDSLGLSKIEGSSTIEEVKLKLFSFSKALIEEIDKILLSQ